MLRPLALVAVRQEEREPGEPLPLRFGGGGVVTDSVAAVSVGVVDGEARLDLEYVEDRDAEVDFNVVMTGSGRIKGAISR